MSRKRTRRIETSYYPQEERTKVISLVRATEKETGQTEDTQKWSVNVGLGLVSCPVCLSEVFWKEARQRVTAP